jgi:hypothetical protein
MSYRSDRARRRASRTRNLRILVIVLVVLALAVAAYFIYIQVAGQGSAYLHSGLAAYLRARDGSPIFSYSTRPNLEMPSIIFSGVALEKFSRIVL